MQPVIVSVAELEDFTRKTASNRYNEKFLTPSTSTETTDQNSSEPAKPRRFYGVSYF